jgi:hypothetical protein
MSPNYCLPISVSQTMLTQGLKEWIRLLDLTSAASNCKMAYNGLVLFNGGIYGLIIGWATIPSTMISLRFLFKPVNIPSLMALLASFLIALRLRLKIPIQLNILFDIVFALLVFAQFTLLPAVICLLTSVAARSLLWYHTY